MEMVPICPLQEEDMPLPYPFICVVVWIVKVMAKIPSRRLRTMILSWEW